MKVKADVNLVKNFISTQEFSAFEPSIQEAFEVLTQKKGAGSEFTGWVNWPSESMQSSVIEEIESTRNRISKLQPDVIVVIGIGGSFLGTKAIYDALSMPFDCTSLIPLVYAGHHLDSTYHASLLRYLKDKNPVVVVISKSGTTTEPAIAFRLIRSLMEQKYGTQASERIIAVTDSKKGALVRLSQTNHYTRFVIPDDIGGRFSVFTPVGLLPLSLCGVDIKELLAGAAEAQAELTENRNASENPAMLYATARQLLYRKGKQVEVLSGFNPRLATLFEWWKQLFGESEGKNGKGIFPASLVYSTDLHSMGQYIQDGIRMMFETFITTEQPEIDIPIPVLNSNDDELLYLEGRSLDFVNQKACEGTKLAHAEGAVPVIGLSIPSINASHLGALMYFFEFSCGLSAYALGVNPFDQPGVEAYKKKMFELLGKTQAL